MNVRELDRSVATIERMVAVIFRSQSLIMLGLHTLIEGQATIVKPTADDRKLIDAVLDELSTSGREIVKILEQYNKEKSGA